MAHPVYVLLSDQVEWTPTEGTTAQAAAPIRWYLRQSMPTATTQTAVLIAGSAAQLEERVAHVAQRARDLGGIAVDATTQCVIEPRIPTSIVAPSE
jgi:hypothetical protein